MLYKKIANMNYNENVLTTASTFGGHGLRSGRLLAKRLANRRAKRKATKIAFAEQC